MSKTENDRGNGLSTIDVQFRAVSDLPPYDRNARVHRPAVIARLVKIIRDIGWTNPVLIDEQGVVAGHKRRLAALQIYAEGGTIRLPSRREIPQGTVPVIDVSGWTEAQRRAYILADNQTTLESEWDGDVLRLELEWLQGAGADMELTGFDGAALSAALGAGVPDNDAEVLRVSLSDRFGVPPFSVLSARDGWWQDRKRAWLRLGIQSELGRGEGEQNAAPGGSARPLDRKRAAASPGGSPRPATNYSETKARGDGRGREIADV